MMGEGEAGRPVASPLRICREGLFSQRELTRAEAEAYHLRAAAKLAGSPMLSGQLRQAEHLREAERNRVWGRLRIPMPAGVKPPRNSG